ncbi:MAG: hypothetical protein M3Y56_02110, partial [Armatimonadota bacterium]|nr:hypothetical protein [Armatimonadota bacterium]
GNDGGAGWIDQSNGGNANYATGVMGNPGGTGGANNGGYGPNPMPRHSGNTGTNFAFEDGHVKFIRPAFVSPGNPAAAPANDQNGGAAAGTGFMGVAPKSFLATFSPI